MDTNRNQQNQQKAMLAGIVSMLLLLAMAAWVRDLAKTNRQIMTDQIEILKIVKASTQPTTAPAPTH